MKALLFVLLAGSISACGSSPTAPSDLPCNVLDRVETLPDGTTWYIWVNAAGAPCTILTPVGR